MRITDTMRAELMEFRALRLELIARGVPSVIADTLAREAIEDSRGAIPRIAEKLKSPDVIMDSIRAATLRGV